MYKGQTDKKRCRDALGMSVRASGFTANLGEIEFIKIKGMWEEAEQKFLNIFTPGTHHAVVISYKICTYKMNE